MQGEHSAILLTFIKLPFVIKIVVFCPFLSGRFTQVLHYLTMGFTGFTCSTDMQGFEKKMSHSRPISLKINLQFSIYLMLLFLQAAWVYPLTC